MRRKTTIRGEALSNDFSHKASRKPQRSAGVSAWMGAAVDKELREGEAALDESEQRAIASPRSVNIGKCVIAVSTP